MTIAGGRLGTASDSWNGLADLHKGQCSKVRHNLCAASLGRTNEVEAGRCRDVFCSCHPCGCSGLRTPFAGASDESSLYGLRLQGRAVRPPPNEGSGTAPERRRPERWRVCRVVAKGPSDNTIVVVLERPAGAP